MIELPADFMCHKLAANDVLLEGSLPDSLLINGDQFEILWDMHPVEYHMIQMHGRLVKTPRWQQTYGMDYHYTGQTNQALPIPPVLKILLDWSRGTIDSRLNGILVNWYDGRLGHYIGRHRDSIQNMIIGAPIVTISFGESRIFRLRPWPSRTDGSPIDFMARNGKVFVMPWETNRHFYHEVPFSKNCLERRVSVTIRGFESGRTSLFGYP